MMFNIVYFSLPLDIIGRLCSVIVVLSGHLTLLLNTSCPVLANSVDPDQLASEEANLSGSAVCY